MKLNMKKVARRIFPVVTAIVILISMPFSASAAFVSYDINDFISSTDVDGANDLMTIVVPYRNNSWHTYYKGKSANYDIYGASVYDIPLVDDSEIELEEDPSIYNLTVAYLPLGKSGAASYFDISNLPSSTVFSLKNIVLIGVSVRSDQTMYFVQEFSIQYYDVNGSYLGTQKMDYEHIWTSAGVGSVSYDMRDVSFSLAKPSGAKYAKFRMMLKFSPIRFAENFSSLTVDIGNFMFEMSITDAERQLLQENKDLLNEVNAQLAEQGKTMNDILNGTPEQNEQISGAVGEMGSAGDKLGDLADQMQVDRPDASDMNVSINSFIPETSLLAYTAPILAFWENDSLQAMLIIVLTLVLVSWVMFGKKG